MKVLGMIQARTGSTRLPRKVLLDLCGKSVLEHVIERVKRSSQLSEVMVVTSITKDDLQIVKLCSEQSVRVFCGSEEDVLDRFYQAAKLLKPTHIVRITADCPLMDPEVIDRVIHKHLINVCDYTSNIDPPTFPDGEDVEVFTFEALAKAWHEATLKSEREHVTPYIRNHKELFKSQNVLNAVDRSGERWTLDTLEDYQFISSIYKQLSKKNRMFGLQEILRLLKTAPELRKMNNNYQRNEGYQKSMQEDY